MRACVCVCLCISPNAALIAPRIKLSKAYIVAEIYETVQLDCIALQGKPEPASYSWQHDNGSSRVDLRIADPTLHLENVSFESTGRYICYVETEGGLAEAHAQLVVHGKECGDSIVGVATLCRIAIDDRCPY